MRENINPSQEKVTVSFRYYWRWNIQETVST